MKNWLIFCCLISLGLAACNDSVEEEPKNGYAFLMQGSPYDFVLMKCGYTNNPAIKKSLDEARMNEEKGNSVFFDLWLEAYEQINPEGRLSIFFSHYDADNFSSKFSNKEVIDKLKILFEQEMTRCGVILEARMQKMGIPKTEVEHMALNLMKVKVYGEFDLKKIRGVLQSSAHLGFFETYDSHEGYKILVNINKKLNEVDSLKIISQPDYDSVLYHWDPTERNRIFQLLRLNIYKNENGYDDLVKGSLLGYALTKDTAEINALMRDSSVNNSVPSTAKFVWGFHPKDGDFQSLYVIKSKSIHVPVLGAESISTAVAQKDNMGSNSIGISMSITGAQEFKKLTGRNIDKAIAILIDGKVISAPLVMHEITDGRIQISGNFTNEEAMDLASMLSAGMIQLRLKIIGEEKFEDK